MLEDLKLTIESVSESLAEVVKDMAVAYYAISSAAFDSFLS